MKMKTVETVNVKQLASHELSVEQQLYYKEITEVSFRKSPSTVTSSPLLAGLKLSSPQGTRVTDSKPGAIKNGLIDISKHVSNINF
jgi:hypothetical protein